MMTYKAFCADVNENPILAQSDETVQNAVYDWFKYRFIGFEDTDKFLDILQRNVSINYPIYQQKLRIEPGISSYDWLVSDYRERQLKVKGETTGKTTYGGVTTTHGEGGGSDIRTGSQTAAKTGTDTGVKTGSDEVKKVGSDTNVKTGGHTETDISGLHTTTTSPHVQTVTSETGGDKAWSGDTQISAQNPMSKSYSDFISVDTTSDDKQYYEKAYQHMPKGGLDWETVSAQAQSGHREYHDNDKQQTVSYKYGDGVEGDIQTTQGDESSPDTRDVVYNSEQDKVTHDTTDTHTYNNITDKTTYDTQDTLTYNSVTDTHTSSEDSSVSHTGSDETAGTDSRTDREQVTGRNEDPATLLIRATEFIERSSAFMWFKEQLDSCFFPGYYKEEDGDEEEGSALI